MPIHRCPAHPETSSAICNLTKHQAIRDGSKRRGTQFMIGTPQMTKSMGMWHIGGGGGLYINNCPTRFNNIHFIYSCKLLYMFRVVTPLIIRSSCHCICSIWYYCEHTATCLERVWLRTVLSQTRSRQVAVCSQ
jgi:hypothetical protein